MYTITTIEGNISMDDDEYFDELMAKASADVVYNWHDCVEGFKQADVDMGSAFHRKLEWMNKAADIYIKEKGKMAGFVGKFANDCGISYPYGKRLNRIRKVPYTVQNFSHDAVEALLSAPEELREEIVSSDKPMTASEVDETKNNYNDARTLPEFNDVNTDLDEGKITPFQAAERVKERKASMPTVPDYNVSEAMGAIKGIAQMYGKRYNGNTEDAAQVLLDKIMEGYDQDDVGLSIARDYAKWFLSLKEVLDLVEPELQDFLTEKPELKVVN
jgi:hypothetical protein